MKGEFEIQVEFDDLNKEYFVILEQLKSIGYGKTRKEALLDLKDAVHCYIDSLIIEMIGGIAKIK